MRVNRRRVETILRAIVHEVRTEKLTFLAGSIAYHAFLSILPLLLLVLTVVQRTQNIRLRDSIVRIMEAVLTPQASEVVRQGLTEADTSVSVLGAVFLVWGALRIFRGLDTAFSDIYETERHNTLLDQLGDGIVLLVTVSVAIVAVSLLRNAVSVTADGVAAVLLGGVGSVIGLFVVLYPMYYIFPDAEVSVVEIVPGTAFAAVGLTVAHVLFTTFKAGSSGENLVASILLLLTWLYVVGLVILLGVVVNAVLSNRSRDVDVAPVLGGVAMASDPDPDQAPVDRSRLLEDLDGVVATLEASDADLTLTVDAESVTVPHPGSSAVDRTSDVFSAAEAVELRLTWWPDGED